MKIFKNIRLSVIRLMLLVSCVANLNYALYLTRDEDYNKYDVVYLTALGIISLIFFLVLKRKSFGDLNYCLFCLFPKLFHISRTVFTS
ncbi:hypothetical protein DFR44_1292 [Hydromonas duriensis]|uniref:Uncharacterized protein n=1 Tax=Hydromonas duriensis TaxID=1527608 RepID=A0A4R6Y0Z8_9BURK|nr:hypothetical protein DFR44_1292 [Hydromonas duriensis]